MPFIHRRDSIKSRRIQLALDALLKSLTQLTILEERAKALIDEEAEKNYISALSFNPGDTAPLLPLGDELVFKFDNLNFNYESRSKFIELEPEYQCDTEEQLESKRLVPFQTTDCPDKQEKLDEFFESELEVNTAEEEPEIPVAPGEGGGLHVPYFEYDAAETICADPKLRWKQNYSSVLERSVVEEGEELAEGVTSFNGFKIKDGVLLLKNFQRFDFDYLSNGMLNEIARALVIFLDSVEAFYSKFYIQESGAFIDAQPSNTFDDSGADRTVIVYDTQAMDDEIFNTIFPIADMIVDPTNRELVKTRYLLLRDTIKFFNMDSAVNVIEKQIDELLFAVNGTKKYQIIQNIETRHLELIEGPLPETTRRLRQEEEVFFPFHNKSILESFTNGLSRTY